jgi:hypothetical protein
MTYAFRRLTNGCEQLTSACRRLTTPFDPAAKSVAPVACKKIFAIQMFFAFIKIFR